MGYRLWRCIRIADVLERLCSERPPDEMVARWVDGDESHLDTGEDTLQDWAAQHCPWEWAIGIGLIDAAEAVVHEIRPVGDWCDDEELAAEIKAES